MAITKNEPSSMKDSMISQGKLQAVAVADRLITRRNVEVLEIDKLINSNKGGFPGGCSALTKAKGYIIFTDVYTEESIAFSSLLQLRRLAWWKGNTKM